MGFKICCIGISSIFVAYLHAAHSAPTTHKLPTSTKYETVRLTVADFEHSREIPLHGLQCLRESYECPLPKTCYPYTRIIGNRYEGEMNRIECYIITEYDTDIIMVQPGIFFDLQAAVQRKRAALHEVVNLCFTPRLQSPKLRKGKETKDKSCDRL